MFFLLGVFLFFLAPYVEAGQLTLMWMDNADNEDGFTLERKEAGVSVFVFLATLGINAEQYIDSTVAPNISYTYRVRAFNGAGPSAWSNEGTGMFALGPAGPMLPLSLVSTGVPDQPVTFLHSDSATQGNWPGIYGSQGHILFNFTGIGQDQAQLPAWLTSYVDTGQDYVWVADTPDVRALLGSVGGIRTAATLYETLPLTITLQITDMLPHRIALYYLDWDSSARQQRIEFRDPTTNALLDSRTLSNFGSGMYMQYQITGPLRIEIILETGINAVVSGIFLD